MSTLEDYLDQLGHEIQASPEDTAEILREIRSHLELAVRDPEGNGPDETARLTQAMERFGSAADIGRELRQVHGRATWLEIGLAALPLLLLGWLYAAVALPVWAAPLVLAGMAMLLLGSEESVAKLLFFALVVVIAAVAKVAQSKKRRRRVRHHVERTGRPLQTAVDDEALERFAEGMDFEFVAGRVPLVQGVHGGFPLRLELLRRGTPRTRVRVVLPAAVPGKLTVRHAPRKRMGAFSRPTGHAEFDREFSVVCFTPNVADRVVSEAARTWLLALGALDVTVKGKLVQVVEPGLESDPDRLRGLVELAVALARGAAGGSA